MSKGYKKVTFIGGNADKETLEVSAMTSLPTMLLSSKGTYFAESPTGGMDVMEGELNNLWHSYSADIYKKSEDNKSYQFIETRMIERCLQTSKNIRCMKKAINDKGFCNEHSNNN